MQLFTRCRPDTFRRVAGHAEQIATLERIRDSTGFGGRATLIYGPSGSGKTTIAKILANTVATPDNQIEIDSGSATVAALKEIQRTLHLYGMGEKKGRSVIINEIHGLAAPSVRWFLDNLEENIPAHAAWIFTTTLDGIDKMDNIDAAPMLSRCLPIKLQVDFEAFAKRAKKIAEHVGLGGAHAEEYLTLAKRHKGNLRAMLSAIEAGEMMRAIPTPRPVDAAKESRQREVLQPLAAAGQSSWT